MILRKMFFLRISRDLLFIFNIVIENRLDFRHGSEASADNWKEAIKWENFSQKILQHNVTIKTDICIISVVVFSLELSEMFPIQQ